MAPPAGVKEESGEEGGREREREKRDMVCCLFARVPLEVVILDVDVCSDGRLVLEAGHLFARFALLLLARSLLRTLLLQVQLLAVGSAAKLLTKKKRETNTK